MDKDFDPTEMFGEEWEEEADEIISWFKEPILEDEKRPGILNPVRLQQIQFVYKTLQHITEGYNVKVSYKLNEPFKSVGSVTVEGKELVFNSPELFTRIAKVADNLDVYPLLKNRVRLTFTFHRLLNPIE